MMSSSHVKIPQPSVASRVIEDLPGLGTLLDVMVLPA
jgi:hypothetical protein